MHFFEYIILRALTAGLNVLPLRQRTSFIEALIRVFFFLVPRYRRIMHVNLGIAFPEKNKDAREEIIRASFVSLARLIVDFIRLPHCDARWIEEHVIIDETAVRAVQRAQGSEQGVIFVSGHIGSFELLGRILAIRFGSLTTIYRDLKNERINAWIMRQRGSGEHLALISRKGGVRPFLKALRDKKNVAVLFDQNVRAEHGVFVDWFGVPAATTPVIGLAMEVTPAPVLFTWLESLPADRYSVHIKALDCSRIMGNTALSREEKIREVTALVSRECVSVIRQNPASWFWMHRRWKTRPPGEKSIY